MNVLEKIRTYYNIKVEHSVNGFLYILLVNDNIEYSYNPSREELFNYIQYDRAIDGFEMFLNNILKKERNNKIDKII